MFDVAFVDPRTYPRCSLHRLLAGLNYLRVLLLLDRFEEKGTWLLIACLAPAAMWRVPILLKPPALSIDVYRYVWDGRIQRLGYDLSSGRARRPHLSSTAYGSDSADESSPRADTLPAAAELFFRGVAGVHESAGAMKLAILLCDIAIAVILFTWLISSHPLPWWLLGFARNPLVAIEGAGNGHIDSLDLWLNCRRKTRADSPQARL